MAEIVLREQLSQQHPDAAKEVAIASAGVSDEEYGNPIDPRARRVLDRAGYRDHALQTHRARPLGPNNLDHGLILAMTASHARAIRRFADHHSQPELAGRVKMFRSFDPAAPQAADFNDESLLDVADPWYGDLTDFELCLAQVESAMPQLISFVLERVNPPGLERTS